MSLIRRIEEIIDKEKYNDTLQLIILPSAKWNMPLKFPFQHDNDLKHIVKLVKEWLKNNKTEVLEWPAQPFKSSIYKLI